MISLDDHDLRAVAGGQSRTTVRGFGLSWSTTRSDRQTCVDAVTKLADAAHPTTTSWWKPWRRDTNAAPRAAAITRDVKGQCEPSSGG